MAPRRSKRTAAANADLATEDVPNASPKLDTSSNEGISIEASRGTKRALSPEDTYSDEPTTPSPAAKKTKKADDAAAKAAKAAERKAKADANKAEKARKANERKWKQDWKQWIESPDNQDETIFEEDYQDDVEVINAKESNTVYGIKRKELNCLPHYEAENPHARGFAPMKLFKQTDVQQITFHKEAILAGISQEDEDELLQTSQDLYEEKHGPAQDLYATKLGGYGRFG